MDDQDVDRFDHRAHEYRMNKMQLRYLFATGIVIALGLSQVECNPNSALHSEYRRGEISGERKCLSHIVNMQAAQDSTRTPRYAYPEE